MPSIAGRLLPVVFSLFLAACSRQAGPPPAAERQEAYADPRSCTPCHQEIAKTYQQTGMGRAFRPATPADAPLTPFTHSLSGRRYQFSSRGGKLFLKRELEDGTNAVEKEIHYVLGSGNHARSYLHRTPENRLIEMPVNWYPPKGGYLAMSPGYDRADHFDMRRAIGYECMFCHNGYPKLPNATSEDDPVYPAELPQGIDCQRCHGPGAAHVKNAVRGNILNPKTLSKPRQLEVCMQCHLEPTSYPLPNMIVRYGRGIFTYNPAEPMEAFAAHFDHAPGAGRDDKFEIASAAYRMRQAKCFTASGDALTCTTCHNPHAVTKSFDQSCLGCHGGIPAAASHPAKKDCAGCHMPKRRTEDVIHVVVTDHRIQRPPKDPKGLLAMRAERHEVMGGAGSYQGEVALYYPKQLTGADGDLYPALAQVAHQSNTRAGIPRLEAALRKHAPAHPGYYLQMAAAYHNAGQPAQAMPYYEQALAKDPEYLPALRSLGGSQLRAGQLAEARATLERAVKGHPRDGLSWLELARVHRQAGRPAEAAAAARAAAGAEPELVEAHVTLGMALLDSGDRAGAEAAFRAALREDPGEADAHTNLGNLLAARGVPGEAAVHLRAAVRAQPGRAVAHFNLALFLANQRQYAEAIPAAREAVRLERGNMNARDLLGNLYAAARQWREAAALYRETLQASPGFPRALLGLGTALGAMNDFAGARVYLQQAAQSADPAVRGEAMELLASLP
jgi:tetratricopeptide (TPR) repeat protein